MMKVLITSPRAPITAEWVRTMRRSGYEVLLCDSLSYPLALGLSRKDSGISYRRISSPRHSFSSYGREIRELIAQVDLVIPTCEDIFYLVQLDLSETERRKCWMPDKGLLLQLHHKFFLYDKVPDQDWVKIPQTKLLESLADLDESNLEQSILKPVFSRFGASVIRQPDGTDLKHLPISKHFPWVQQEKIIGQAYCNFAICEEGRVIAHAVYRPRYLLNDSASTYFEAVNHEGIAQFTELFVRENHYHGQLAFDFIDNGDLTYLLECNPRSTSGFHLLADGLVCQNGHFTWQGQSRMTNRSIGKGLFFLFGWKALIKGKFGELIRDYRGSETIFQGLNVKDFWQSLREFKHLAKKKGLSMTSASTYDIEYNGQILDKEK